MPYISTGWHYSMLLSSEAEAWRKITLLFVITKSVLYCDSKRRAVWTEMDFLVAQLPEVTTRGRGQRLGWVGNPKTEMNGDGGEGELDRGPQV